MRWFFFLVKIFISLPVRLFLPYKVIGKQRLPRGKNYVSVSNHLSFHDVIALDLYLPGFRHVLAKKELNKNRLTGFLLKKLGAVYIDRKGFDFKAIKNCIECLKKAPLAIFPEGTRNKDNEQMQQVKGGAAMIAVKADVYVIPIMIHHRTRLFRRNYMLIGEKIELPYTSSDRFNAAAMNACTEIISGRMVEEKQLLDRLVAEKSWKQYRKEIKLKYKSEKKATKAKNGKQAEI